MPTPRSGKAEKPRKVSGSLQGQRPANKPAQGEALGFADTR